MFEYSKEYLMTEPENVKYVEKFSCPNDLIEKWYDINYNGAHKKVMENRIDKLNHIYQNGKIVLDGHGLEMAFGFGESIYVLMGWYKNITMDAFDFNPLFRKIIPLMKGLHKDRLIDVWIGDAQNIPKLDNCYDFINSCSFFEHLPDDVYWNVIRECYRVLKPGKVLGVYLDGGRNNGEHIRCVPVSQTKKELESIGFVYLQDYLYQKPN